MTKSHKPHNHWSNEEDQDLKGLVRIDGAKKWKTIALKMKTKRDAKQCRERFHGHLKDNINKKPLTKEEDDLVVELRNLGYGWAEISRAIEEKYGFIRTANQLKNNFNQRLSKLHPDAKDVKKSSNKNNDHHIRDQINDFASDASILRNETIESSEENSKLRIEAYVAKSIRDNEYRYNNIAAKTIEINTNNIIAIESTKFNVVEKSNKTEIATNTFTKKHKFEAIAEKTNELNKLGTSNKLEFEATSNKFEFEATSNKFEFGAFAAKATETNKFEIGNIVAKSNKLEIGNIVAKSNKLEIGNIVAKSNKVEIGNFTTDESKKRKFDAITAETNVEYSFEFTIISRPIKKIKSKMDIEFIID